MKKDSIRLICGGARDGRIHLACTAIEKDAPEFVLFKAGWTELADGIRYQTTKESFDLISAYWQRRGVDILIDYEHESEFSHGPAPAAGWIRASDLSWDESRGIIARPQWTERAAEHIRKDEYRYYSQVFDVRRFDGVVIALYSVALTNTPRTNDLTALAARFDAYQTKEESMEFFVKLLASLGLKPGASEQDVLTAIATLSAAAVKKDVKEVIPREVLSALDLQEGSDSSAVVASINAIKQQPKGMVSRADYDALKARLDERDAADVVVAAMNQGKITPDQKDWALDYAKNDPKGFAQFLAKAPVVVPVDGLPKQEKKADTVVLGETALFVASLMGNTPEDLKKYAGGEV